MIILQSSVLIKFFKVNIPKELKENCFFCMNVQYSPSKSVRLIRSISAWKMTRIFYLFVFINLWKFMNLLMLSNGKYTGKYFLRFSSLLISMFFFTFWNLWFLFHFSVFLIEFSAASFYLFYLVHMLYRNVMQYWQNSNLRCFFLCYFLLRVHIFHTVMLSILFLFCY